MAEDLQSLLEKINREGVEKARSAADAIIADAKAKAAAIVKSAEETAAKAKDDAEKSASDYISRARETIGQAERDTVLKIEGSVTAMLERLLAENVEKALADEKASVNLVTTAIKELADGGEITCGPALAQALKAQAAVCGSMTVVTDETFGTGFSVSIDNGRVEHAFKGATITAELARRLRPDLAALLK